MLFSSTSSATLSLSLSTSLRWRLICVRTCVFWILQNITSIWCVEIWFEFNFQLFEGLDDITWLTQANNLLVQYLPRASRNNSILSIFLNVELWILDEMSQVTLNSSVNFVIYCIFGDKFKRFISLKYLVSMQPTFMLLYFLQIFSLWQRLPFLHLPFFHRIFTNLFLSMLGEWFIFPDKIIFDGNFVLLAFTTKQHSSLCCWRQLLNNHNFDNIDKAQGIFTKPRNVFYKISLDHILLS